VRLFLAINFPAAVRHEIATATAPLRDRAPELGWTVEDRLHLTLKFLGEQAESRVDALGAALAKAVSQHRELAMTVGGIGAFPNFRRARVVWMDVSQEPRLELLHHDIEVAYDAIGCELEGRPFRPHLTLARVRDPLPVERMRELWREAKRIDYTTEFIVHSVDLMQSDPSTSGPRYTTLVSAPLRST
jgi:RNA 2',3'-cyclic 3'-phosphodiesterase